MARTNTTEPGIPVKIVMSLLCGAVGLGASLFVDSSRTRLVFGLSVSLFVAGIALVVQFLYEVETRLDRMEDAYREHADSTERRVSDGFTKISEATELFGRVEASALNTDAMTQLVRHSTRIESDPTLLFDFAQSEISRLSEMLKALSDGADVPYEGEDRDWMLGLTRVTRTTIEATSLATVDAGGGGFVDGGLWASDLGQHYLDEQAAAIRRGVVIRRIFVMDRSDLLTDPEFLNVCRVHRDIGIEIRVLDPAKISGTRRDSLFDFIIFDGVLSYQATAAARVGDHSRPVIVKTQLITRQDVVADRIQRFDDLWQAGTAQE